MRINRQLCGIVAAGASIGTLCGYMDADSKLLREKAELRIEAEQFPSAGTQEMQSSIESLERQILGWRALTIVSAIGSIGLGVTPVVNLRRREEIDLELEEY